MGVPRGNIRPHAVVGGGIEFVIWGDTDKLSEFFTDIEEAQDSATVDRVIQMPQMTVKRYPGDPGFTRRAHQRRYSPNTGLKRVTTPGKIFHCEQKVLDVGSMKIEWDATQFTHTGPIMALRAYARSNAAEDFRLRWASGRFEDIKKGGPGTTVGALGTDRIAA
jgi:hypothetical protein